MSLAVAVIGDEGLGLATDSIRVDGPDTVPIVNRGVEKTVRSGRRIATIVGMSSFEEVSLLAALGEALDRAREVGEVPWHFQKALKDKLAAGARRYVAAAGSEAKADEFLILFCAEKAADGSIEAWVAWADPLVADAALFDGFRPLPASAEKALVLCLGVADEETLRHATAFHLAYARWRITGGPPMRRPAPPIPAGLPLAELEKVARDLVAGAVGREASIPRPSWYPDGLPVLSLPVFGYRL